MFNLLYIMHEKGELCFQTKISVLKKTIIVSSKFYFDVLITISDARLLTYTT